MTTDELVNVRYMVDDVQAAIDLAAAGPEETAAALAAVAEAFDTHHTPREVALGAAAWLVSAATPWACPVAPRSGSTS